MTASVKTRILAISAACVALSAMGASYASAQTTTQLKTQEELQKQAYDDYMAALNALNAQAGNTNTAAPAAAGVPGIPPLPDLGQKEEEPQVIMSYDKKAVEGFYGVELPKRLFNNVLSEW
ncbi:MAG: hypothetical protein ACK4NR_06200 [Micavibrio sp.]